MRGRVAVVGTRGFPGVHGGVERHCEELYPRLVQRGWDVTVYCREGYVSSSGDHRGVHRVVLPAPNSRSREALWHSYSSIAHARTRDADIVHIHSIGPGMLVPVAKSGNASTILTVHARDYQQQKWGLAGRSFLRMGESVGCRFADSVISVSRSLGDYLGARYGRDIRYIPNGPGRIEHIPNGPTVSQFDLVGQPYILFVGRLIPDKRVEDAIAAVGLMDGVKLVVVGDASYTDDYGAWLRRNAPAHVVFTGHLTGDALSELYSSAAACVLPSQVEGLPLCLLEAMSLAVPCVASSIPANKEIAGTGGSVELYPVGNVPMLTEALVRILSDPSYAQALGQRGRLRVVSEYDWERIADQTSEAYCHLLG